MTFILDERCVIRLKMEGRQDFLIPKDWVTGHLPHEVKEYTVGLFNMTKVLCCSCGISASGRNRKINTGNLYMSHYNKEMEMRAWLNSIQHKPSKGLENYFK